VFYKNAPREKNHPKGRAFDEFHKNKDERCTCFQLAGYVGDGNTWKSAKHPQLTRRRIRDKTQAAPAQQEGKHMREFAV